MATKQNAGSNPGILLGDNDFPDEPIEFPIIDEEGGSLLQEVNIQEEKFDIRAAQYVLNGLPAELPERGHEIIVFEAVAKNQVLKTIEWSQDNGKKTEQYFSYPWAHLPTNPKKNSASFGLMFCSVNEHSAFLEKLTDSGHTLLWQNTPTALMKFRLDSNWRYGQNAAKTIRFLVLANKSNRPFQHRFKGLHTVKAIQLVAEIAGKLVEKVIKEPYSATVGKVVTNSIVFSAKSIQSIYGDPLREFFLPEDKLVVEQEKVCKVEVCYYESRKLKTRTFMLARPRLVGEHLGDNKSIYANTFIQSGDWTKILKSEKLELPISTTLIGQHSFSDCFYFVVDSEPPLIYQKRFDAYLQVARLYENPADISEQVKQQTLKKVQAISSLSNILDKVTLLPLIGFLPAAKSM